MTEAELIAKRDKLIEQLASAQQQAAAGRSVTNRSAADIERALSLLEVQIAKGRGAAGTYSMATVATVGDAE